MKMRTSEKLFLSGLGIGGLVLIAPALGGLVLILMIIGFSASNLLAYAGIAIFMSMIFFGYRLIAGAGSAREQPAADKDLFDAENALAHYLQTKTEDDDNARP